MVEREPTPPIIRFDDFEVDVAASTLRRGAHRVRLQEKPYQLLLALLDDPGTLVSRELLRERLWPKEEFGQFDDSLNTAVLKLRRALGDSATTPRYIETVRRHGYRFVAAVDGIRGDGPPAEGDDRSARVAHGWLDSARGRVLWLSTLVAVLAVAAWFGMQREAVPFVARDWIVISEFENVTGDEAFDRSLRTALTTGIRQSRYVNVLPDSRIDDTLDRMGREPGTPLSEGVCAEVAAREGARLIVVGSVSRIGEVYELAARLVDPQSLQDVAVETARAPARDDVIVALDEIVGAIRQRLGESRNMVASGRVPLPKATTSSLEALKLYAEATTTPWTSGNQHQAVDALERAIELDPDFALAHMALGAWCYARHDRSCGETHFEKALALADRLTHRERLWLEADVEGWRGNTEAAVEGYRRFVAEYPDAARGWFRLGYQYLMTRQCDLATQAFRRVLELEPTSGGSWVNIATCQAHLNRYEDAVASYHAAFKAQPSVRSPQVLREYATVLVLAGRRDESARVFREMSASDDLNQQAIGDRGLGFLDLLKGNFNGAVSHFRTAVARHEALDDPVAVLRCRVFTGWTLRALGERESLSSELDLIEKQLAGGGISPYFAALAAKLLAREGRRKELGPLVKMVAGTVNRGNPFDHAALHLIQGETALLDGDHATALTELEDAVASHREPYFLESLAEALAREGRANESIELFEEILDRQWFGYEAQFTWMWAPYRLAQLASERGDHELARTMYQRFVDQWPQPDPRLIDVADARCCLDRLP